MHYFLWNPQGSILIRYHKSHENKDVKGVNFIILDWNSNVLNLNKISDW